MLASNLPWLLASHKVLLMLHLSNRWTSLPHSLLVDCNVIGVQKGRLPIVMKTWKSALINRSTSTLNVTPAKPTSVTGTIQWLMIAPLHLPGIDPSKSMPGQMTSATQLEREIETELEEDTFRPGDTGWWQQHFLLSSHIGPVILGARNESTQSDSNVRCTWRMNTWSRRAHAFSHTHTHTVISQLTQDGKQTVSKRSGHISLQQCL